MDTLTIPQETPMRQRPQERPQERQLVDWRARGSTALQDLAVARRALASTGDTASSLLDGQSDHAMSALCDFIHRSFGYRKGGGEVAPVWISLAKLRRAVERLAREEVLSSQSRQPSRAVQSDSAMQICLRCEMPYTPAQASRRHADHCQDCRPRRDFIATKRRASAASDAGRRISRRSTGGRRAF